jgi:hypothetical protein
MLKTLNSGLEAASLPDGHIEEAFDVWWPKLDAELKKLPPDESSDRPHRSERDLLEEILDFVRNQSRFPAGKLTEDDRNEIIKGRIIRTLVSSGNVKSLSTATSGPNMEISVTGIRGKAYTVVIPKDTPLEEIETRTKAQMPAPAPDSAGVDKTESNTPPH